MRLPTPMVSAGAEVAEATAAAGETPHPTRAASTVVGVRAVCRD